MLRVTLTAEYDAEKGNRPHDAGADSRRDKSRKNHIGRDGTDNHGSSPPARQTQAEGNPCRDGSEQRDMRAGN